MTTEKNCAHAHRWGNPWINDMGIFPLNKKQISLMLDAHKKNDYKILLEEKSIFYPLVQEMKKYITENCKKEDDKIFFRLSTLSPKDVRKEGIIGPILYSNNLEEILDIFVKSERIAEDLEDYRDFAIIFKKWNAEINTKNEYRCFIFENKCECILSVYSFEKLGEDTPEYKLIEKFIDSNKDYFPEKDVALDVAISTNKQNVIFIEFNCVDCELDTFDMNECFSDYAKSQLDKKPKNL